MNVDEAASSLRLPTADQGAEMLKRLLDRLPARRPPQVVLCETCSTVCDATCRAQAIRDTQRTRAAAVLARW